MRIYLGNKKKKEIQTNEDSESEDERPNPLEILNNLQKFDVYSIDNHIYFKTEVSPESIDKLNRILEQKIKEFEIIQIKNRGCKIESLPLYLHITSGGGCAFSGFLAIDLIERSKIPIYTIVEGYANSASSCMAIAGKKRYMTRNSYMLIHQLSAGMIGSYEKLTDDFINSKELMERIKELYVKYSNGKLTKSRLKEILKHDRYWDFAKCKKYGLVDELYL